ncbi:hypothetical protein DFH07DRAFT_689764, partial [Mycena maculata]
HIGGHILRAMRKAGEPKKKARIGGTLPCGFCGHSGHAECQVFMKPSSKKNEFQTKCQHQVTFQFKTANKSTAKGACRNVPMICGLCPTAQRKNDFIPAVWRYNMPEHLRTHHSEYASPQNPEGLALPFVVWQSMEISMEEELGLGVHEFLI